jgi:hypothetical protein
MKYKTIKIAFVYPPIPVRDHDWQAYYEGDEESGSGFGESPGLALENLYESVGPASTDETEPNPATDTDRLDWIEANDAGVHKSIMLDGHSVWRNGDCLAQAKTAREAIDAAKAKCP